MYGEERLSKELSLAKEGMVARGRAIPGERPTV
jgi:hypothetical protein